MTGRDHRLAVIAGDGVGPELMTQALRVLDALKASYGFGCDLVQFPHSAKHYLQTGELFDEAAFTELQTCESLLFGAVGDPSLPPGLIERALILGISGRLELSIGVRGGYLHAAHLSPLKGVDRGDIDTVIVRDCTEGELTIPGGTVQGDSYAEVAASIMVHTRHSVDRTLRYAFDLAGTRRRKLDLVVQSNVLAPHQLWERRINVLRADYPDVETSTLYPDNAVAQMVTAPQQFDVIVTPLWLGGMLSDLLGALVGGIGLIGSVRFNPETRFGMYEPAHGSAPKYTGLDRVSPMATFNALAMLLTDIGESAAADGLRTAIDDVLANGHAGLSTHSPIGTVASTDAVLAALAR